MEDCFDAGAEDFDMGDDVVEVTTSPEDFSAVRQALEDKGIQLYFGRCGHGALHLHRHFRRGRPEEHGKAFGRFGGRRRRAERVAQPGKRRGPGPLNRPGVCERPVRRGPAGQTVGPLRYPEKKEGRLYGRDHSVPPLPVPPGGGQGAVPLCDKPLVNSNPPGTLPFAALLGRRYTVGGTLPPTVRASCTLRWKTPAACG